MSDAARQEGAVASAWRIEYSDGAGEAATAVVTTGGTGAWRTATFSLPDAYFDGRFAGGMDFRVANRGPNDLTVRFLRVVKTRPPAPAGG